MTGRVVAAVQAPSRPVTEPELVAWGEQLGRTIEPQAVLLSGDLGAGKTTLAKAICRGYGVREDVTSPTFALVHVYESTRSPVYHADLYRLDGPRDLQNIGWDDMLSSGALVIVEWPDRAGAELPDSGLEIELQPVDGEDARRRVSVRALGPAR